ncbi:MAG: TetR/AcrR family transcriptional regulator [Paracoccaceae bacterium]
MGRLKTYDRDDVARKAMQSFWRNGFHASSTKQLASDMGVNVYSLFAEFDSKQGLFEAALEVYGRDILASIFCALDTPDAGLKELRSVISYQGATASSDQGYQGCFYCNTATERGFQDQASRTMFGTHIDRVQRIVERALQNAVRAGDLSSEVSCRDQGALIVTTFQGLAVLARARVDSDVILAAARAMNENLDRMTVRTK